MYVEIANLLLFKYHCLNLKDIYTIISASNSTALYIIVGNNQTASEKFNLHTL